MALPINKEKEFLKNWVYDVSYIFFLRPKRGSHISTLEF